MEEEIEARYFRFNRLKIASDIVIPISYFAWLILSLSIPGLLAIPMAFLFIAVLFLRSYFYYVSRMLSGSDYGTFRMYVRRRRVMRQNVAAGAFMGLSGIILKALESVASYIGAVNAVIVFDLVAISLVALTFFRRPGMRKTLSGSVPVSDRYSRILTDMASRYRMPAPQLRVVPQGKSGHANAWSLNLPRGRSYVFADEELFIALEEDEVGAIFAHELAHLKFHHSSRSYLITAAIPLLWLNAIFFPYAIGSTFAATVVFFAGVIAGILYLRLRRGTLTRRYEMQADTFAGRNYDREVYLRALRKLTSANGGERTHGGERVGSHYSLEEREQLIRGL